MSRFVLIDGNAILHRAYHALPPLTDKNGVLANAVYGFFSMYLKIIEDLKPSYIAVCFDRPKPTFRQELYAGYQQNRPAMKEDLVPQIGMVHAVLEKVKVQIFEIDGYEADDLIGTLAYQSQKSKIKSQNLETIIVSGDRDLLQLITQHVKVLMPITGLSNTILHDSESVKKKYGVTPSQFIDYKALVGDASDGYPGVAGIGPKTASELINKYGSFENLYKNVGELPEKIGLKLATDAEQASLAKKLATIVTDAPITFDAEKCSFEHFSLPGAREAFEELGFKSLLKRFEGSKGVPVKTIVKVQAKEKEKKDSQQLGLL